MIKASEKAGFEKVYWSDYIKHILNKVDNKTTVIEMDTDFWLILLT